MDFGRQVSRYLYRLVVKQGAEFEFGHYQSP
jgi:hypothetical protein